MKLNAAQPGIHALHLTYPLKTGVEYQWAIAAVADPNQQAGDPIAGGTIQRVEPTPALAAQLDNAPARVNKCCCTPNRASGTTLSLSCPNRLTLTRQIITGGSGWPC